MARLGPVVVLLLLGSALAFRISDHHVHKKVGHAPDLRPASNQLRETRGNQRPDDIDNSLPKVIENSILGSTSSAQVEDKSVQENLKDNNQEQGKDKSLKD